jgi:hypothetical protein
VNTTTGVLDERPEILLQPGKLGLAQVAHAAGLQLLDVDQSHEMHAVVVEAVPAVAQRALAVAGEVGRAVALIQHVVLARHVEHGQSGLLEDLVGVVELLVAGQLADVAVCRMKAGCSGRALILAIASRKVARASGLGGLLKPMWLSLT